ncbi:MAG: hypothetical protein GF334_03500 [Candidatus Altiarchaeales archaeon]|nr:hypothetical protein [Candidatus Altiarchaeales archaeon]
MKVCVYGLDFDGTICDTGRLKKKYLWDKYGIQISLWQANRTTLTSQGILTDTQYNQMVEYISSKQSTLNCPPLAGVYKSIKSLSEKGIVYIITGRNGKGFSTAVEWMHKRGLDEFVEGYITSNKIKDKLGICCQRNITHLIDDDPGHFKDMNPQVKAILMQTGLEQTPPDNGVIHVNCWEEAMKHL